MTTAEDQENQRSWTITEKPILCIDFDGVIHSYDHGWQEGAIPGIVVDGFFEWAEAATAHFRLVIYSSRSKSEEGVLAMARWLHEQRSAWCKASAPTNDGSDATEFEFMHEKPAAFLTIDDRALTFNGNWHDDAWRPEKLRAFKPWDTKASGNQ